MADVVIRDIAFYWRNKKAATVNSVEVEFSMGREPLYGQEGIIAYSKGVARMKLTIGGVVPVTGSSTTKDIEKILSQEDIDISFTLGGSAYRQKMAVLSASFKSDSEKKTTTEQVVLEGAKPDIG